MGKPNNVRGCVGSKSVTQMMWTSILVVVLLFTLLDIVSCARPLQNPSGFQSLYHLEGPVMDTTVEMFDAESNRGVAPVLQSQRLHELRYRERILDSDTNAENPPPNFSSAPPSS